ncbi:MAG: nitroreductase family protein [Actinomycetota bacterium]
MDRTAVDKLLTTTRTVRKRLDLDRPVEAEVINECLEIAMQAPTGSNLQAWRWVIVTDADKRAKIAELYRRAIDPYHKIMSPMAEAVEGGSKVYGSSNYLAEVLHRVPVHVIPTHLGTPAVFRQMLTGAGYPFEVSDNHAASGFYGSIWPAVWSFMLALRSRGLGSALTTMHLALEREVGELLGIPDTVTQAGLIPVAYYTGETFKPAKRRPAVEITYWNGWKS